MNLAVGYSDPVNATIALLEESISSSGRRSLPLRLPASRKFAFTSGVTSSKKGGAVTSFWTS